MISVIAGLIIRGVLLWGLLTGGILAGKGATEFVSEVTKPQPTPAVVSEIKWNKPFPPSPTPTPTSKPTGKTVKPPTPTPIPVLPVPDPDPIVTCYIHASCGGGSRQMKRSECNQTTCCQIEGKWYFYLSKEKCKQDQNNYWSNYLKRGGYTPPTYPTLAPLPTLYPPTSEPYIPPAPLPTPTPFIYIPPNSLLRAECLDQVRNKYKSPLIQYGCSLDPNESCEKYDPTSACCAVKAAYIKEMEKCSQLYP